MWDYIPKHEALFMADVFAMEDSRTAREEKDPEQAKKKWREQAKNIDFPNRPTLRPPVSKPEKEPLTDVYRSITVAPSRMANAEAPEGMDLRDTAILRVLQRGEVQPSQHLKVMMLPGGVFAVCGTTSKFWSLTDDGWCLQGQWNASYDLAEKIRNAEYKKLS